MEHDHTSGSTARRLVAALAIVAVFLVVEVAGAALSGSLTLLADAGHMASDVIGLVIALVATGVAARPATDRSTFGYRRAGGIGALLNRLLLAAGAVTVAVEGISPLLAPAGRENPGGTRLAGAAPRLLADN